VTDSLSLQEAAKLAGVPETQLKRWAWEKRGPRFHGSKLKPRYMAEDIEEWRFNATSERIRKLMRDVVNLPGCSH